jgi:hypothetical protein
MGMKKAISQEIEEQQLRWYGHIMRMETAQLLNRLQNGTHRRKGGVIDQ